MLAKLGLVAVGGLLCAESKVVELGDRLGVHSGQDHKAHAAASVGWGRRRKTFGGDKMYRSFTRFGALPIGRDELDAAGWHKMTDECDPKLGYAYTKEETGPTIKEPLMLYVTEGGQSAGVGTIIRRGEQMEGLGAQQQKYKTDPRPAWSTAGFADAVQLDVAFRSPDIMCNGRTDNAKVGTRLTLNPKGPVEDQMDIPLLENDIRNAGWRKGSCFSSMGWHWFKDMDPTVGPGKMSWNDETLLPVVAMYDKGDLNAIFFVATQDQTTVQRTEINWWEPTPLDTPKMCYNTCDMADCMKTLTPPGGNWGTMHIFFKDHTSVVCETEEEGLQCLIESPIQVGCCPKVAMPFSEPSEEEDLEDNGPSRWLVGGVSLAAGAMITSAAAAGIAVRRAQQPALAPPVAEMS